VSDPGPSGPSCLFLPGENEEAEESGKKKKKKKGEKKEEEKPKKSKARVSRLVECCYWTLGY